MTKAVNNVLLVLSLNNWRGYWTVAIDKKQKQQKNSVNFKKIFLEGKLPSSDDKTVQEACSKVNLDERLCK